MVQVLLYAGNFVSVVSTVACRVCGVNRRTYAVQLSQKKALSPYIYVHGLADMVVVAFDGLSSHRT